MTSEIQELDKWAAEVVMGWTWSVLYSCPCIKSPKYKSVTAPIDIDFDEVPDPSSTTGGTLIRVFYWHPSQDANQCFMVVKRMRELEFNLDLSSFHNSGVWQARFIKFDTDRIGPSQDWTPDENPKLAILKAAYVMINKT